MEFEIRELQARDVAPMARIMGKVGIKQIANALSPASLKAVVDINGTDVEDGEERERVMTRTEEIGMGIMLEIASVLCENFDKAEKDLFRFLASMAGMKEQEVAKLSLADTLDLIAAVFTSDGFSDFFKRVQASLAR